MARTPSDADYARLLAFRTELRRFERWSQQRAETVGLTGSQHQLLLAIRGHGDKAGPTITDASEYLQVRHHTVVGLADRMEALGLVGRRPDPTDHRLVRLTLTAEGRRLLRLLSEAHLEELARIGPVLDELVRQTAADPPG